MNYDLLHTIYDLMGLSSIGLYFLIGWRVLVFSTVHSVDASLYPNRWEVFRIDNTEYWTKQGFTSHHPRGSLAFKIQKEGVVTYLRC